MRTLCDFCESAPAVFFCAADQAALCSSCDDKVHKCNKLASRHVTVKLADPKAVLRCDICEKAPAFFFCEVDGTSLCLQCDMVVHVGGKRTHGRYLLLRQIIEFPTDKPGQFEDPASESVVQAQTRRRENQDSHQNLPKLAPPPHSYSIQQANTKVIDLNTTLHRSSDFHPEHQP